MTTAPSEARSTPIRDLGYRGWQGDLIPDSMRWWVITTTGVRMAWKMMWLRRLLFFAWMPAAMFGFPFFFYEQALQQPSWKQDGRNVIATFAGEEIARQFHEEPAGSRHLVWSWLIKNFFQLPQSYLMIVLVGLVAPPLIARDMRSRAFLLYFSRPLTRGEYILGKASTVWCYLLLVTALPSLALYIFGVLLSPELSVVWDTWDIPLRILGATIVVLIPPTAVALVFSSLTNDSRYAGFAWFAVWVLGEVTWGMVYGSTFNPTTQTGHDWKLVSLIRMLRSVESWIFGLEQGIEDVLPSLIGLAAITVVSVVILFRRVAAPMRI